ncbi:MAG: helix-turn-helix domain-containing protein [Candidatus Verstraetearchaeota archaeon]|nr:helix-turn-helix domain-containing protein [Candidatus Verstraetearchaeota archaeon]
MGFTATWEDFLKVYKNSGQPGLMLRTLRFSRGISIEELSAKTGISEKELIAIELGASDHRFNEDQEIIRKIFETLIVMEEKLG